MGRVSIWAAAAALGMWGCGDSQSVVALAGSATCSACHSGPGDPPPFRAPGGLTNPSLLPVGAHTPHLNGGLTSNITCSDCHIVPSVVNVTVPAWQPATKTCTSACHSNPTELRSW